MQNYLQQPYQQGFNRYPNGYKVLPVASENEVSNITVDFNGTPTYFHNQMTNEIYVKQFDIKTGVTSVQKFVKNDSPIEKQEETKIDYSDKFEAINTRIDGLKDLLENLNESRGGKK